ncbi:MAG TPA: IclR family transcriptional regulator C-terminal domain-containing protein [Solirubrobacteraceae bacterium]
MPGDSARVLTDAPVAAASRSLSTARAVLRVFALLLEHPEGVRADEVAKTLGKSVSTAYYLLTSLCEEGFAVHESKGVYRRARGLEELTAAVGEHAHAGPALHDGLAGSVDELFLRTRKRSYLGVVKAGRIEIVAFCGRQGVPRMPGLGSEIRDSAHALAMGKVVLSLLSPSAVARYVARGLTAFTPRTVVSPTQLADELQRAREAGYAVDREEFDENFCCIAAPVFDAHGRFVAALGASMTANVFDADRDELAPIVVDVARHAAGRVASTEPPAHVGETRRHRLGAKNLQAHAKTAHFLSGATPAA